MKKNFKLFVLGLLLVFASINLFGQEIKILNGAEYQDPSGTGIGKLLGEDATGFYALRSGRKDTYFIEKYNFDMKQLYSVPLEIPKIDDKDTDLESLLLIDNTFYMFNSFYNKKSDLNTLYLSTIDSKSGKIIKSLEVASVNAKNSRNKGSYIFNYSKDNSKILIVKNQFYDKNESEKIGFLVFDKELNKVWGNDVELPYVDKKYSLANSLVDNDGNLHLIAKVQLDRSEKVKGEPNYFYEVLTYFHKDKSFKQYEISLGEDYISSIDIRLDNNNNLSGSGFYSEKKGNNMKGIVYFAIEPALRKVKSVSKKEFTKEFLMNFMSEKKAEKGRELRNYYIRDIITKDNGGVVIVAEYYTYQRYTTTTKGQTRTTEHWYFNDLIVTNIKPDGNVDWFAVVPKRQHAVRTSSGFGIGGGLSVGMSFNLANDPSVYLGIATMVYKDKINIIYNENPKNLEPGATSNNMKYMNNPKKSITTMVSISVDGKITKTPLFSARNKETGEKSITKPRFNVQTSDKSIVLFAEKGKNFRFIKVQAE